MSRMVVFGGYGVFGSQVAQALSAWSIPLTIAGRDRAQAEAFARKLGGDCRATAVDISQPSACQAALRDHTIAINCAGPFQRLDATLPEACLQAGCHYVDIADDRGYTQLIRSLNERFQKQELSAIYGCSSLPGISGALALRAREGVSAAVDRVRVTLFIGNHNPKGEAAARSLLAGLGKPIEAPQGTLLGFHDREVVPLPAPFGRRGVFNFESPEYDLYSDLLGARAVAVKVGFELRLATYAFALMARLGSGYGRRIARLLELPGKVLGWMGCSGGVVMTELFFSDGSVRRAALSGKNEGQRMAALPCALAARALWEGKSGRGAQTAYEFLGGPQLLAKLVEEGFELHVASGDVER